VIRYALACSEDHQFEAWFRDSQTFDAQHDEGLLACPVCGSAEVSKTLMRPAVATARKRDGRKQVAKVGNDSEALNLLRQIRNHLTEHAEFVGDRFAEEARRIHYEESEKRAIYGEADAEQARSLAEEGIEFHPLPVLPEDHN